MSKNTVDLKLIKDFPDKHPYFLKKIMIQLNKMINGKRGIMYSDIINLIVREGIKDDKSKQLILWCNYKMKFGEIFVEF